MSKLHRKTRKRYEVPQHLRFLTFSCFQRLPLFHNDKIKEAFANTLSQSRKRQHFRLIAWVVMPEHVHILLVPDLPTSPVSRILKDLKNSFANQILKRWRALDAPILVQIKDKSEKHHFWQAGGGYDRNVYSAKEYEEKFNYIHNNPVSRGLVDLPEQWRWSSASWYEGVQEETFVPIDPIGI